MKVIFAAYRDWAMEVLPTIKRHPRVTELRHVSGIAELELLVTGAYKDQVAAVTKKYDLVLLCGWSWQVSQELLARIPVISEHPAYLDEYSLGTPLQAQILDGIRYTKHRVVKIGYPELGERLYSPKHEVDMNLTGNMDDILGEMASTCKTIYNRFLDDYPTITWEQWPKSATYRRPRKPEDSRLEKSDFSSLTTSQLYDRLRMLEAPYPNAFIEDDDGILTFERVSYKSKR
jgi:methionyl-tRNA formyltransferase